MKHNVLILIISLLSCTCTAAFSQARLKEIKVSDDVKLVQVSSNAYVHESVTEIKGFGRVSSNGLVLVDNGKAFLFDTPASNRQTELLVSFIEESLHSTVIGFVPNHWHEDCIGGLDYLNGRQIPTYAHQMTADIATSKGLPELKYTFSDSTVLKLNDIEICCYYFGPAHSMDNVVVWIPSQRILFPGCMVKSMQSTTPGNLADADILKWPQTLARVIDKFPLAEVVIPGHGAVGGKELLMHTLELIRSHK